MRRTAAAALAALLALRCPAISQGVVLTRADNDDFADDKPDAVNCQDSVNNIRTYTITNRSSRAVIDHTQCVSKKSLDDTPKGSYILITMASDRFVDLVKELIHSLMFVPQKGGLPEKIIIADLGMRQRQVKELAEMTPVELEVHDYRPDLAAASNLTLPGLPEQLGYMVGDKNATPEAGAPYRVKAKFIADMLENCDADQMVYVDAGGIFLDSIHRVRNVGEQWGLYIGMLPESAISSMVATSGLVPLTVQQQRINYLKEKGNLPSCFDYETDYQVDTTKRFGLHDERTVAELGSVEGGFIVVSKRHRWVHEVLQRWSDIMTNDTLWIENLGYFFAFDQKILTNELWKAVICGGGDGKDNSDIVLLDVPNVRFGSVTQYGEQVQKDRFAFHKSEVYPWSGYTYHHCMNPLHRCHDRHRHFVSGEWQLFARGFDEVGLRPDPVDSNIPRKTSPTVAAGAPTLAVADAPSWLRQP